MSNNNSREITKGFDMNKVLTAQNRTNELLNEQKSAVIHGNILKSVDRFGNLTGDSISLS